MGGVSTDTFFVRIQVKILNFPKISKFLSHSVYNILIVFGFNFFFIKENHCCDFDQ